MADRRAGRAGPGAAIVSPAALSIITTTFSEGAERNRALGMWGAVAGAGGAAGVLLGGVLTSGLSWRWVLFVNVPIGVICVPLSPRVLQESRSEAETRSFDIPGAVTVTAGLALLVYALVNAVNAGWGSSETLLLIAGAFVLLATFWRSSCARARRSCRSRSSGCARFAAPTPWRC